MSIWDGFRNRLGASDSSSSGKEKQPISTSTSSSSSGRPVQQRQDVEWNSNLERKLKGVLHQLKVLTKLRKNHSPPSAEDETETPAATAASSRETSAGVATTADAAPQAPVDPALEAQGKRVGEALKDLLPALALPTFAYGNGRRGNADNSGLSTARKFFLDLWHLLVLNIESLEGKHQKHGYEAISYLVTREEFDVTRMGLHHDQLRLSKDELLVVHRYRVLLFHTQAFVNIKLSDIVERPRTPPYYLTQFCARMLAINFFRLPGVSQSLIQAVALTTQQLSELETYLVSLQRPASSRLPIGDHRPSSTRTSISELSPLSLLEDSDQQFAAATSPTQRTLRISAMTNGSGSPLIGPRIVSGEQITPPGKQDDDAEAEEPSAREPSDKRDPTSSTGNPTSTDSGTTEDAEKGDGRSARRYTFTQGRCYYLMTQFDNTQKNKRNNSSPASTQTRNSLSSFPNLTTWNAFHSALLVRISDTEDEKLRLSPTTWLKLLSQRDRLYVIFLRDWVDHILYNTQGRPLEWSGVKGYMPFLLAFIYELRSRKHLTKPFLDCTNAFLATDPALINLYMKIIFSRTKLYDTMAVVDALSHMENWMEQFRLEERPLPPAFDHSYMVEAFELILSTEHHQLLLKILMFLYQYAEVFMGEARVAIYSDFILERHFFYFFLHWDINVRNAFHQLLAYKMLRTKRSQLQGQGLRVKELASVRNGSGLTPNARRQQIASTIIDREHALDIELYEKIEEKLKIAGNQIRGLVKDCYPTSWEVYVPIALSEYKRYLALYYQWETSDKKQPKMQPLAVVERTPPPEVVLAQPRPRPSIDGNEM